MAAPQADLVKSLPGLETPFDTVIYSGFVDSSSDDVAGQMHSHYMFVPSKRDPKNDPVLVWFNGGPGASSLFGMMIELGPFLFSDLSLATETFNRTGIPSPIPNPHSWSNVASVLAISAPPPVGFSWCDKGGVGGAGTSCGDWNDTRTAVANHVR